MWRLPSGLRQGAELRVAHRHEGLWGDLLLVVALRAEFYAVLSRAVIDRDWSATDCRAATATKCEVTEQSVHIMWHYRYLFKAE